MKCVGSFSSDLFSPHFLHNSLTCLNSAWQGFTKGKVSNLTFQTAEICHPLYIETIHFETCSIKSPPRFVLMPTLRSIIKILNTPPCYKLQPRPSYTTPPLRISLSPPPKKNNNKKSSKNQCINSNRPFPLGNLHFLPFFFSNEIRHFSSYHCQPSSFRFSGGFTGGFRLGLRLWAGDLQGPGGSRSRSASRGPIGSMYGIFTFICLIFMVNVGKIGKYTIHGSYGCWAKRWS